MKLYAACPICAHKLLKGICGTEADIKCSRCGHLIKVTISGTEVKVESIKENANQKDYLNHK